MFGTIESTLEKRHALVDARPSGAQAAPDEMRVRGRVGKHDRDARQRSDMDVVDDPEQAAGQEPAPRGKAMQPEYGDGAGQNGGQRQQIPQATPAEYGGDDVEPGEGQRQD